MNSPAMDMPFRIWQENHMYFMKPSEGEIVWVFGENGIEGKSWFQRYLTDLHGSIRVLGITSKKTDGMLHVLSTKTQFKCGSCGTATFAIYRNFPQLSKFTTT